MTEKAKKLLEILSGDKEFLDKVTKAESIEAVLALTKEKGLDLTEDDIRETTNAAAAMDQDELTAVSGGKKCYCFTGGGGTPSDDKQGQNVCACVIYGAGDTDWIADGSLKAARCSCPVYGEGEDWDTAEIRDEASRRNQKK